jgi:hypothetical protein
VSRAEAEELAAVHKLTGLLRELVPSVITCEVWLQQCGGSMASVVVQTGGYVAAVCWAAPNLSKIPQSVCGLVREGTAMMSIKLHMRHAEQQ